MSTRTEQDSFGPVEVPSNRLWGAHTQRSLTFFRVSSELMPAEVIQALALIKKAAATVNARLGGLKEEVAKAIGQAADEVLQGLHSKEFPLSVWQTGSGTQSNMNMNEVLANRASQLLGGPVGRGRVVHPNDDVNRSQSSNDVFPSAMNIAAATALHTRVVPELEALQAELVGKAAAFREVLKLGRTHLQDATPLTVGQELGAFASQLSHARSHLVGFLPHLYELALGGTAVGTGLNAPRGYATEVAAELAGLTGLPLVTAPDKFEAVAASDALVQAHGGLRGLAAALFKVANDLRLLSSGPRAGLAEYRLPENEPGSSIMPGKVNPTQCEMMTMACARVFGNDVTMTWGGASGQLQLNTYRPMLIDAFLQSSRLLADGMASLRTHCLAGLELNRPQVASHLTRSLMLVTALAPHIGYERAAHIAKKAHDDGTTLREAALALGLVSPEDFDAWVRPEMMVGETDAPGRPHQ